MAYSEDQKYWIWLASVYGLGARRFDALLQRCEKPQQVWEEFGPWMTPYIGAQAYASLSKARNATYFGRLFDAIERCGAVAVTRMDVEYPTLLLTIPDPPPVLYVRGRVALNDPKTLAIVGARNCTAYGDRMARRIARELSRAGVTVVSGLALGIDGAAHRGAVDAGARTVAVLGSGVDVIYPPAHNMLAQEILDNGGSIISEQNPGATPSRGHFPARNRIISGMSEAVLLVEAAQKSGTMSTIGFALDRGQDVFALPGQADSPYSASPHALIRSGGRLVTSAADILEDMKWPRHVLADPASVHYVTDTLPLTLAEQRIYNLLAGGPVDTDALVTMTEISPQELSAHLTVMELNGVIRKLPGRRVERVNPEDA